MNIEQQITVALAGRADQRDFVDSLSRSWTGLSSSFDALLAAAADLTRGAATATAQDSAHATVFGDIGTAFGGGSDWQKRAAALSGKLAEGADRIGVLHQRVHRETVNIGAHRGDRGGQEHAAAQADRPEPRPHSVQPVRVVNRYA